MKSSASSAARGQAVSLHHVDDRLRVDRPIDEVRAFFERPGNLDHAPASGRCAATAPRPSTGPYRVARRRERMP
jgi:hypothetical protein